jgi:putative salt-induced outer membrane protein YdiY
MRHQISFVLAVLALLLPVAARADRVTVKGTVLEGKVKSITKTSVVMETVYGAGDIVIATKDIEAIETDVPFHIFHGDDVDSQGPVVGVSPEQVTVKPEGGEPEAIAFDDIYVARRDPGPEASVLDRLGVELAYWQGNFDFGFSYINATADSNAVALGAGLMRERGPSRLKLEAAYHRSTSKNQGESTNISIDELYGQIRQEYDLTPRFFAFGSQYAENDGVENLGVRLISRVGFGYKLFTSENAWITLDGGPGYVYERYYGGDTNQYPMIGFGAESNWKLPLLGASWHNRLDWTPSVLSPFGDFLLRGETALLVPLISRLSFKVSLVDVYNNSPADGTQKNSLAALVGLSLGF